MNIQEALRWSKANGGADVARMNPGEHGFPGWVRFDEKCPGFIYRLSFDDLTAEDWRPSAEAVEHWTGGKYTAAKREET